MKTRRREYSEAPLTITRRRKTPRKKTSENSEPIPFDLIFEILLRLPAKSIAKCRCVSKVWASILSQPHFLELFSTRSSARPQLLFACESKGDLFFFSAPQIQNPDSNSSPLTATLLTHYPLNYPYKLCDPICGLVCCSRELIVNGKKEEMPVVCNPSTGQSLNLPVVKTNHKKHSVTRFFKSGYDPIEKQFKVLSMTYSIYMSEFAYENHQVLTLGSGNLSWRTIECDVPHYPEDNEICIDGVVYYPAICMSSRFNIIVCFDVRSEKFSFIELRETFTGVVYAATLVNYSGKLGLLLCEEASYLHKDRDSFELWVLEDLGKRKWSKRICVLPALWKNIVGESFLSFVGVTQGNEIVMTSHHAPDPFYLIYYNLERNTTVRVEIQGIDASKFHKFATFIDYVDDAKLL